MTRRLRFTMTFARRLKLAFAVLCGLTVLVAGVGAWGIARTSEAAEALFEGGTVHLRALGELHYLVTRNRVLLMDVLMRNEPNNTANRLAQFDQNTAQIDKLMATMSASRMDNDERALFARMASAQRALQDQGLAPLALALAAGQSNRAQAAYRQVSALNPAFTQSADGMFNAQAAEAEADHAEGAHAARLAMAVSAVLSLVAVALAGLVGLRMARGVMRTLGAEPAELMALSARMARGQLTGTPAATAPDGSVMAWLYRLQTDLADIVQRVRAHADGVATASAQIAQGNQHLSGRTEQQASALQETAATMEQLVQAVRLNADHAQQADTLAHSTSGVVAQGGQVVGAVVATMGGIRHSSQRIGDITSVIDGIAFQTNILALNAAVEAARAGEQGRGFAVEATEVRSLAQRCAEAAREIRQLIGHSVQQVTQGAQQVDQAGATMGEIVDAIQRVGRIVADISLANQAQIDGVLQIGDAVPEIDQTTQQNAALVEQSAAAADSLRLQAQQLVQAVAVFQLPEAAAA